MVVAVENIVDPDTGLLTLVKKSGESTLMDMDLSSYLRAGDTILSLDSLVVINLGKVTGSADVTTIGGTASTSIVQATYVGGTDQEDYKITATVTTNNGDTLTPQVLLRVRD